MPDKLKRVTSEIAVTRSKRHRVTKGYCAPGKTLTVSDENPSR